jgi:hypothetical protein
MKTSLALGLLSIAIMLSACRQTQADTETADGLTWTDAPVIHFVESARITSPVFGVIRNVRSVPGGDIVVGDWSSRSFTVMDASGAVKYSFGAEGEGPGEFRYLPMLVVDADSFYTFEMWPVRLTAWPRGTRQPQRIENLESFSIGRSLVHVHEGTFVTSYMAPFMTGPLEEDASDEPTLSLGVWKPDVGSVKDSVRVFPADDVAVVRTENSVSVYSMPFGRRNLFASGQDGILAHAWSAVPEVELFTSDLELVRTIRLDYQPTPVTRADLEAFFSDSPRIDDAMRRAVTAAAPSHWPAISQLIVDDDDQLWIGLTTPRGEPTRWVVASQSGEIIGQAELPEDLQLYVVREGSAFGVYPEHLETGGPLLIRFEVTGPER